MTAYTISGKQAIFFIGGAMPMLSKCEDSNEMNSSKEYFKKKETNKEAIHKGVYSTSPVATPIISVKTIRIFINRLWRRLMREVSTRSKSPRLRFFRDIVQKPHFGPNLGPNLGQDIFFFENRASSL